MGVRLSFGVGPVRASVPLRPPVGPRQTQAQRDRAYAERQRISRDSARRKEAADYRRMHYPVWTDVAVHMARMLGGTFLFGLLAAVYWSIPWLGIPLLVMSALSLLLVLVPFVELLSGTHVLQIGQRARCESCGKLFLPRAVRAHERSGWCYSKGWVLLDEW